MKALSVFLGLLLFHTGTTLLAGTTYFIRTDGGDASQCSGRADAPYPGSGTGLECAWSHPFIAFPPDSSPRISGGDTLLIHAGSYRMGISAPGTSACDADGSFDCVMSAIPSGNDADHRTRILGEGWENGCTNPPELWGSERPWYILNLDGSSHVEIRCLEITDHSNCIEFHSDSAFSCQRDQSPYGDWAATGIFACDSSDVVLADLDIHGLADNGIHAGRLNDWSLDRVRIFANGWAGWDGDLWDGGDSNSGILRFRRVEVGFNGCSEDYLTGDILFSSCWSQTAGGYGDGLAAGNSGGTWIFEDCRVHHNTSDGIDLLYLDQTALTEISGLAAEGNAGNQVKFSGAGEIVNSVLVGNCSYFSSHGGHVDDCRALGNTISLEFFQGQSIRLRNLSVTGEGDCLTIFGCRDPSGCDGTENAVVRNVIFEGKTDYAQPWDLSCLYWYDDSLLPSDPVDFDFNLVHHVKDGTCPGSHSVCGLSPGFFDQSLSSFDPQLSAGSPAIDAADPSSAPEKDFARVSRDSSPDIGAWEYGSLFGDDFEFGDTCSWDSSEP